jgi:SAM-dependent methyltransferase
MMPKRQGNPPDLFPRLYHAHHSLHMEDLPFWLHLAQQNSGPILELGCGTGRVLLPLAAGYPAFGLDLDIRMLRFCAERFDQAGQPGGNLFLADMSQFHLGLRFGLIMLPCNTLSTLAQATLEGMLASVQQHLLPDGIFAASLPNPILLRRLPKRGEAEIEDIFPHPLDSEPVQVSSAWERDELYFNISWRYDHLLPDGQVERLETSIRHQLNPADYYRQMFKANGLNLIEEYGDFDRSAYYQKSDSLIFTARRAS